MKKIILALLAVVIMILPISAFASTDSDKTLASTLEENKHVESAVVLTYGENAIVALHTIGVVTKSAYNQLIDELTETIKGSDNQITNCIFTRNIRVFRKIESLNLLSDENRQIAIDQLVEHLDKIPNKIDINFGR